MKYVLAALCWATTQTGLAEPPSDTENVTEFSFDADQVHGDLARPIGEVLHTHQRRRTGSLVRVRRHFIDHLLRSIEQL